MTAPGLRRRDPLTFATRGWEAAVVALGAIATVLASAALAGLALASLIFGDGWTWPADAKAVGAVLKGLAAGHPEQGLSPAEASLVPGRTAVYSCVLVVEALAATALVWVAVLVTRRMRTDGMATRDQAQQALGLPQLRRARSIIRPDLYANARMLLPRRLRRRRRQLPFAYPHPATDRPISTQPLTNTPTGKGS